MIQLHYAVLVLILFKIVFQPTINYMSPSNFESIKINNAAIGEIWGTNGDQKAIESLFGPPTSVVKNGEFSIGILSRAYHFDGFQLGFSNQLNSKGNLVDFTIAKSAVELNIQGLIINVGDHISELDSYKINLNADNTKSIIFAPENESTIYLFIDFNAETGIISKIGYFVLT